jgi:hypothetical protein
MNGSSASLYSLLDYPSHCSQQIRFSIPYTPIDFFPIKLVIKFTVVLPLNLLALVTTASTN